MMAAEEGGRTVEGTIGKSPIERDIDTAEVGENTDMMGGLSAKATCITCMAASDQWERIMNVETLKSKTSD